MSELLDIDALIEQLLDDDQSFPGPNVLVKYLRELKEFRALDTIEVAKEKYGFVSTNPGAKMVKIQLDDMGTETP